MDKLPPLLELITEPELLSPCGSFPFALVIYHIICHVAGGGPTTHEKKKKDDVSLLKKAKNLKTSSREGLGGKGGTHFLRMEALEGGKITT